MPACFQLIDKTTNEPHSFVEIDESLCAAFGVPVDPDKWYKNWYNAIGFCLAMGQNFDKIRTLYHDSPYILAIVDWLSARYVSDSWHEMK